MQGSGRRLSRISSDLHSHGWVCLLLQRWSSWRKRPENQPWIPWMPLHRVYSSWDAPRARFVEILPNDLFSLGAVHEHSRPDRDSYVSILIENVEPGSHQNFRKESNDTHSGRGTPFDPHSIMIYGPKDFGIADSKSERKTTIQPLDPNVVIR